MSFEYTKYKRNEDGNYGPTSNKNFYKSVYYHQKKAIRMKGKTQWNIEEDEEFGVFKCADENKWLCIKNNALFSIINMGKEILGKAGERLAMFRVPVNDDNLWHGFPVSSQEHRPSSELLDHWQSNNIVSRPVRMRIERSQL